MAKRRTGVDPRLSISRAMRYAIGVCTVKMTSKAFLTASTSKIADNNPKRVLIGFSLPMGATGVSFGISNFSSLSEGLGMAANALPLVIDFDTFPGLPGCDWYARGWTANGNVCVLEILVDDETNR